MIDPMSDDGGLSEIRSQLASERSRRAQQDRRDIEARDVALREQGERVQAAIGAFLAAACKEGIGPEEICVGYKYAPPRREGWLFSGPPPPPPVPETEPGFNLYEWQYYCNDSYETGTIVLWCAGEVELRPSCHADPGRTDIVGALPFHLSTSEPEAGSYAGNAGPRTQLQQINQASNAFVRWLAEYLEKYAGRGVIPH